MEEQAPNMQEIGQADAVPQKDVIVLPTLALVLSCVSPLLFVAVFFTGLTFFFLLSALAPVAGLILGIMALTVRRSRGGAGRAGFAIAAIVVSAVFMLVLTLPIGAFATGAVPLSM